MIYRNKLSMINQKTVQQTIQIKAVTEPLFLARMTVLLRKYDVVIDAVTRQYQADGTEQCMLLVRPQRDNLTVAMKKLERLVPIIEIRFNAV